MTMTEIEIQARITAAKAELTEKKNLMVSPVSHQFQDPFVISRKCPISGEWHQVTVEASDWNSWRSLDAPLKPATAYFPYLKETEIEFLLSGISQNGIQHLFRDSEIRDVECED